MPSALQALRETRGPEDPELTLADFDRTVRRIQAGDFEHGSGGTLRCSGCDMRFYCGSRCGHGSLQGIAKPGFRN